MWINYCKLLIHLKKGTATRKAFDRALRALPVTQHEELWGVYVEWARTFGVPETGKAVLRRYLMFEPSYREPYIEWCLDHGEVLEAIRQLKALVDSKSSSSADAVEPAQGKTKGALFLELCELCTSQPAEADEVLDVDALVRGGISLYPEHTGRMWCQYANYMVRQGKFAQAREVFEEAINTVMTVRDFSMVFDALVKVEEGTLMALMQGGAAHDSVEVEERMEHIEATLEQRPLMLNKVLLRQNPNNVHEWIKRIDLLKKSLEHPNSGGGGNNADADENGDAGEEEKDQVLIEAYETALQSVQPTEAVGRLSTLWAGLAGCHEKRANSVSKNSTSTSTSTSNEKEQQRLQECRQVWRRACRVSYRTADELAIVYVFCYTIALPSFLVCDVSVSLSSVYGSLLAFSDTT
jgi:pre-mRNA-splicing factor SYF1